MFTKTLNKQLLEFAQNHALDLVILFGSHAKGTAGKNSDLDVAISSDKKLDITLLNADLVRLTHENNIDLVDLKNCHPTLGMQIMQTGKVIFSKPSALGNRASIIFRRFADTKKFRELSARRINLFLEKKGLS